MRERLAGGAESSHCDFLARLAVVEQLYSHHSDERRLGKELHRRKKRLKEATSLPGSRAHTPPQSGAVTPTVSSAPSSRRAYHPTTYQACERNGRSESRRGSGSGNNYHVRAVAHESRRKRVPLQGPSKTANATIKVVPADQDVFDGEHPSSLWSGVFVRQPQKVEVQIHDFELKITNMQARLPQATDPELREALVATKGHAGRALFRLEGVLGCRAAGG